MANTDDVKAGRLTDKILDRGIVVPANLQTNELTLREHQEQVRFATGKPLTEDEIRLIHGGF